MKLITLTAGFMDNHCYLLITKTKKAIVIDPGVDGLGIYERLMMEDVRVEAILLTHGHLDHIGQVTNLMDKFRALGYQPKVYVHPLEEKEMTKKILNLKNTQDFPEMNYLEDGDVFELEDIRLKCILVPGHTAGSLCFYAESEKVLFSGDTLFYHSIGTERYYDGDPMDLTHNIKERLLVLPYETQVYPGHKAMTTIGEEAENNRYLTNKDTQDPWDLV
jgi:hydroxyacylglutathione hydrolase